MEYDHAIRDGELNLASELKYGTIPQLQAQLDEATGQLVDKQEKGSILKEEVTENEIAEVVSEWTGIPVRKMMEGELEKLRNLEADLHKRVVGQDKAVAAVAGAIRRSRTGLADPSKPIGTFLFLGPTGVGKTELAKALAQCLFDDEKSLVRIDMSEYMEKFSVQRLIGAPPGYVGYDEGGQLTEAVRRRPYSVILLDEIEKAHPDVFNVLLQVLDDGRLTDGQGRVVNFSNSVIIMTSNAASVAIREMAESGDEEKGESAIDAALKLTFRPEFINRIDDIITFEPLGMEVLDQIVALQLKDVRARLAQQRIELDISPAAMDQLSIDGLDPVFGARPLKRLIQRDIIDLVATAIVDGKVVPGSHVLVDIGSDGQYFIQNLGHESDGPELVSLEDLDIGADYELPDDLK